MKLLVEQFRHLALASDINAIMLWENPASLINDAVAESLHV